MKYENPFKQKGVWLSDDQYDYLLELATSHNHRSRSKALRDLIDEHRKNNPELYKQYKKSIRSTKTKEQQS